MILLHVVHGSPVGDEVVCNVEISEEAVTDLNAEQMKALLDRIKTWNMVRATVTTGTFGLPHGWLHVSYDTAGGYTMELGIDQHGGVSS